MKMYEELARLKVNEAIQRGLEAQRYRPSQAVLRAEDRAPWAVWPRSAARRDVMGGKSGWRGLRTLWAETGGHLVGAAWLWAMARLGER
jgi:hypothetical protein